jgi:hypothetical protein
MKTEERRTMTASSGAQHECGSKPSLNAGPTIGRSNATFEFLQAAMTSYMHETLLVASYNAQQSKDAAKEETTAVANEPDDVFPDAEEANAAGDGE